MRYLLALTLLVSLSAFAQKGVKENIKQQTVATSPDGSSSKPIKGSGR